MGKKIIEVSQLFYPAVHGIFLCLVTDNEILNPIKVKIRRNVALSANVNPSNCKANFFITTEDGARYYHHVSVDFLPRKQWLEFNMKQFIEKIGFKYYDVVLVPYYPDGIDTPYFNGWKRYPTDTEYGIYVTETKPPCLKHVYLVRDTLVWCGKSVAKIEYDGRTNKKYNLPEKIVISPHSWTDRNIDAIIREIPQNWLRGFKVYFYDHDMAYRFTICENRVNIAIYPVNSGQALYTHLTSELDEREQIRTGFQMLFSCISAGNLDLIKKKMSKYQMMGY